MPPISGINLRVFSEFSERLETSDPGVLLRLAKIREEAVETAKREVLSEGEECVGGWTLLSPTEGDTVRAVGKQSYEEKVLLLSDRAVYVVRYEFNLQKVVSFTRVPTGEILNLQVGVSALARRVACAFRLTEGRAAQPYILSALDAATRDPTENYGLKLFYEPSSATNREKTYTTKTKALKLNPAATPARSSSKAALAAALAGGPVTDEPPRFFAFKALQIDDVHINDGGSRILSPRSSEDGNARQRPTRGGRRTAKELVDAIVAQFVDEGEKVGVTGPVVELKSDGERERVEGHGDGWVVYEDIISLEEARAQVSIGQRLSRTMLRAIWW